ncbi:PP2C family protein-serine/threonine phosphatase [Streptomyces liangshanensis]|uniref:Serine/threonine-protein phosphatase n=1 Tax=Streptomyces liangshanensis TaxID=2717324 RepID=A0A6G9GWI3_9ACTN|nr:PP2C family protein-serine/threonine phosphatase [Streptomyces liangshanensis]QIQ02564.1 serine/threonine-protein phosphatase [Streptomyces liangshanensis]
MTWGPIRRARARLTAEIRDLDEPSPAYGVWACVLSVVLSLGLLVTDVVVSNDIRLAGLSGLGLLATAMLGTRRQAQIAATAVAAVSIAEAVRTPLGRPVLEALSLITTALFILATLLISRVRIQRERLLAETRAVANAVQNTLLQPFPLTAGALTADGFYLAAQQGARVGGDIYEVVDSPYGVRILIGDVQGHGLAALGAAHAVLTAYREAAFHQPDVVRLTEQMEAALLRYNAAASVDGADMERFVTATVIQARPDGRTTTVVCGHVPHYVVTGGRVSEVAMNEPGLPLGLGPLVGVPRTPLGSTMSPDCVLVLCTDGVTEARDRQGVFFPLPETLQELAGLPPDALLERLRTALLQHSEGELLADDAAVLVVTAAPVGAPPE